MDFSFDITSIIYIIYVRYDVIPSIDNVVSGSETFDKEFSIFFLFFLFFWIFKFYETLGLLIRHANYIEFSLILIPPSSIKKRRRENLSKLAI